MRQTRRYRGIDRGTGSERLYVYAPRTGKSKGRKGRRRSSAQSNWSTKTTMPFPYKVFVHALREQLAADEITVTDKKSHNSADIDELLNSIRMAYRDKVENAMVAVSLAEGGDFDAAQDVLNEKDLLAEHKL